MSSTYLVFDVGGTFTKYAIIDHEGNIVEKSKVPSIRFTEDYEDDVNRFINQLGEIYDSYADTVKGIAVSLPGTIDVENGIVYGGGMLVFLDKVPLAALLSKRCNDVNVALENDGKCAALAEAWIGNASGKNSAFVMVLGTGLGGGLIIDGRVFHGANLSAGEISFTLDGMSRDQIGILQSIWERRKESYEERKKNGFLWCMKASSRTIVMNTALKKNLNENELTGELVFKLAEEGDEEVKEILEDWYFEIAKYCCNIKLMLDPAVILLGGGISARPELLTNVRKYIKEFEVVHPLFENVNVDVCKFRNDSNLYGALRNYILKYE